MIILNKYAALGIVLMMGNAGLCMEREKKKHAYLQSQPFQERIKKAAELVKDYAPIIEVGGGMSPISNHIKNVKVIVIDPEIRPREEELVVHIRKGIQDWKGEEEVMNQKYAVVILGLELSMQENGWSKLYDLINGSQRTVIEYSATFKTAKRQVKAILRNTNKKITQKIEFDFSNYNFSKCTEVHPLRKMICLDPNK